MLHIIFIYICILFCIFCIYMINMQIDLDNLKCLSPGLHCLLQLLLRSPSQGPAVHVPPSTTITTVFRFVTESTIKVSRFSSHGEGYCPGRAHWNQRKASQYGLWRTLESHTRLVLVHRARRRLQIDTDPPRLKLIYNQNMQNMQNMHNMT